MIKVRYALKTWGYKFDKCALCSQVETVEQCFLFCPRERAVWNFYVPHFSRLSNSPFSVNSFSGFFPLSCRASLSSLSFYCYLIATILFWIWQCRNLATCSVLKSLAEYLCSDRANDISLSSQSARCIMRCDSIATTISRMEKEPTTLGLEDLKGHRFAAFCLR